MHSRSRVLSLSAVLLLSAGTVRWLVGASSNPESRAESTTANPARIVDSVPDKPLADFQDKLLDLAFNAATALPVVPHIKNRSRAQEAIVTACLNLDQPRRALGYVEKIGNWRRGAGYAELAFYCAQHGDTAELQGYLDLASRVSESVEEEGAQDWQRDRIRVTIAKTHIWLGQIQEAARFEAGLVDSEAGKVETAKAMRLDANALEEQLKALDAVVATGNFEQIRNVLETSAQLFNRFYEDEDRRSMVEQQIRTSWSGLPIMIQMELMMELTEYALKHADPGKALDLVQETQLVLDGAPWTPEDHIALMAKLAGLRYRAGDQEKARSDAEAALAMFDAKREEIVNIYRAAALRSLAESYQSMRDTPAALTVYKRAVEAGVENPNSKPRAEDLSATCGSMALHEVEPDTTLWARLSQIYDGLGQPW